MFSDLVRSVAFVRVGINKAAIQLAVSASSLGAADELSALREDAAILAVATAAAVVVVTQAHAPSVRGDSVRERAWLCLPGGSRLLSMFSAMGFASPDRERRMRAAHK